MARPARPQVPPAYSEGGYGNADEKVKNEVLRQREEKKQEQARKSRILEQKQASLVAAQAAERSSASAGFGRAHVRVESTC